MGVFCLTAPNIAASVSRVVIAIPVLPGMDSGGRKRESQDTITNRPGWFRGQRYHIKLINMFRDATWKSIEDVMASIKVEQNWP